MGQQDPWSYYWRIRYADWLESPHIGVHLAGGLEEFIVSPPLTTISIIEAYNIC